MPGVGKSTAGVLLAKATQREFLDTDVYIQARNSRSLQDIIASDGLAEFCRIEAQCILDLDVQGHVIATGGSVVYSSPAMKHLRATGPIVHLDLELALLTERINNLDVRGVVIAPGQTLQELYTQRQPLYKAWADLTVDSKGKSQDKIVSEILTSL